MPPNMPESTADMSDEQRQWVDAFLADEDLKHEEYLRETREHEEMMQAYEERIRAVAAIGKDFDEMVRRAELKTDEILEELRRKYGDEFVDSVYGGSRGYPEDERIRILPEHGLPMAEVIELFPPVD